MKILFLDIDGVLINRRYASRNTADPRCVEQLNRITETTGAKIVVSSSWRHYGLPKVTLILRQWGVSGDIIDITPNIEGVDISKKRRCEIMDWMDKSEEYSWLHDTFVVLDDEPGAFFSKHTVMPDFETGLEETGADKAISILKGYGL